MYWVILSLVALVCLHLYQRLLTRRERRMLQHLPTWTGLPFIGNSYKFIGIGGNIFNIYNELLKSYEATKLPFLVWFLNTKVLILSDPEEIKAVSNTNLDKSHLYKFADIVIADGLITAPGSIWKQNIKKLGSAFKASNVDAFQVIFNDQAQKLVKRLQVEVNGDPFELQHKYLTNITLRAICESGLGVSASHDMIDEKFTKAFTRMLELCVFRLSNICLHPEFVYRMTAAYKEVEMCSRIVYNITDKVLKQKICDAEANRNIDGGNQDTCKMPFKSFLDILLEMRETDPSLTEEQIRNEVTTILLAGLETTATALNVILLVLGSKPDVQRKLYDEIRNVFGDTRRPVSKEDLGCLSYCEAVIYETLRLYPPVPGCLRYVDHDVQLKSCTIPKGTICAFALWCSGRSEHVWGADALFYKPDRWLDPSTASKISQALIIFSTGKRTCIGRRYAINLIKTILVHSLMEFEFISEVDELIVEIDVLLRPSKSNNLLQIRRRNRIS